MRISDRKLNRLAVLKAIRRHGPVSRSDLPGLTGLSGGTITQVTGYLVADGLVVERKDASKRNGRPRIWLEIARGGAVVVGARLSGRGQVEAVFVDLAGNVLFTGQAKNKGSAEMAGIAHSIADALAEIVAASPFAASDLLRIGLSLPAMVNSERGEVHFLATFPPQVVPFAAIIAQRLGVKVTIENELSTQARAEHWFGRAQDIDTFTLIEVGHTIGSAEYAEGLPQSGANGLNPEFGHTKLGHSEASLRCICGASGCLITTASIFGLVLLDGMDVDLRTLQAADLDLRLASLLDRAESGDGAAAALLDQSARHLGHAVANYIAIKDPGTLIITVMGERFLQYLSPRFRAALEEHAMPGTLAVTDLRLIPVNTDWQHRGAAALALEQAFLDPGEG